MHIKIVAIYFFILFVFSVFFFLLRYTKQTQSTRRVEVLFLSITMGLIAFRAEANIGWDLFAHFRLMDQIRQSKISLLELLFHNPENIGGYSSLFTFNLLRYILCKLSTNNHWLPFICVTVTYLLVGYIMTDWNYTSKLGEKFSLIAPLLCTALLPPVHAISGMRTALASAIMGLAIYRYIYKRDKAIKCLLLVFLSITIHQVTIIAIPAIFLSKFHIGKKGFLIAASASLLLRGIAEFFLTLQSDFLSTIARLYLLYSSNAQYRASPYSLWACTTFLIAFLLLFLWHEKEFKKAIWTQEQESLYYFLMYYCCLVIGNVGNYDLLLRPCYLLGVFAPVLISLIKNTNVWTGRQEKTVQIIGMSLCTSLCFLASFVNIEELAYFF